MAWFIANNIGAHEPLILDPVNAWAATLILAVALDLSASHAHWHNRVIAYAHSRDRRVPAVSPAPVSVAEGHNPTAGLASQFTAAVSMPSARSPL